MKKSYKKMIAFQSILVFILIINSLGSNILKGYGIALGLGLTLIIFKKMFGLEKERARYRKDTTFDVMIYLLVFYILYYLLGVFIGFVRTRNYYTKEGLVVFIIPLIITVILKELIRYNMLRKNENSKKLTISTTILFILLDITNAVYYASFTNSNEIFLFLAITLLPAISRNIVSSYISKRSGYVPVIIYLLVTGLVPYLMPIVPNPNEYLVSLIGILIPVGIGYKTYKFYKLEKDEEVMREYRKKTTVGIVIPTILTLIIVYLTSGYFHYYALAIASGSMSTQIKRGDVVIVEKSKEVKEGEVVAYRYHDVTVVHRIAKIIQEGGKKYYYTKGDANKDVDNYVVEEEMIIGKAKIKIPFIGLPTVWLNEL